MLQKPTCNLTDAIGLIGMLRDKLETCHSREKCQKFWDNAKEVANCLKLAKNSQPTKWRQPPAAVQNLVIKANIEEGIPGASFNGYIWDVYVIVEVKAQLKKRFDDKNIAITRGITSLCPSSSSSFCKILCCKLATFKHLLERKEKWEWPGNPLEMQPYLQKLKEAFLKLHHISLTACTLPVSSAECEWNFSSMQLIKIDLQTVVKWVSG